MLLQNLYAKKLVIKTPIARVFIHTIACFRVRNNCCRSCTVCYKYRTFCDLCRGKEFRRAFAEVKTLTAFFPSSPMIAMSGTLTVEQIRLIPKTLGMRGYEVISENPDRPNITLVKTRKAVGLGSEEVYEAICYGPEIDSHYS